MTSSELKLKAKELLNGKKKNAAIMLLVFLVISWVLTALLNSIFPAKETTQVIYGTAVKMTEANPLASIIQSFVSIFLGLGMTSYYMKLARGEEPELTELFSKGNILLKAFVSAFLTGIVVLLGTIAFIIPGIIF